MVLAAALAAGAIVAASSAGATTYINETGKLASTTLTESNSPEAFAFNNAVSGDVYYLNFTVTGADLESQAQANVKLLGAQDLDLSLWSGTFGKSGATEIDSTSGIGPDLIDPIKGGNYFIEIEDTGASKALVSGSISVVPEPAAWAMMILGMGGMGVLLRRRQAPQAI
jgi:hypothetical protein